MIALLDKLIKKALPKQHAFIKSQFNQFKKKVAPKITKAEFVRLLQHDMQIKPGDTVFVHSSMRSLYLDFSKRDILDLLLDAVGEHGTLLFPCWHFNTRAEDYIQEHDVVFDIRNTPSAMGKLSDVVRFHPLAARSLHPTNSVVAVGKHAQELTASHHTDVYPCGKQSPFYKMMQHKARIIGIGVSVNSLTFVHTVEDIMKDEFPLKTRMDELFDCKTIDIEGNERIIKTYVASKAIGNRDVYGFFKKNVSQTTCNLISYKGMHFFSAKSPELYEELEGLARQNKTIYLS